MIDADKFWDKQAQSYAESPIRDEETYRKKLEITQGYFNSDSEVFEFACGTGSTAIAHAAFVKHITAVDISSAMVEIAQGKAQAAGIENVSFQQSTIEQFNSDEARFDVAMAHNILHLLADPKSAIAKTYQLLKPGGVFVTSTACLKDASPFSPWRLFIPIAQLLGKAPYVNLLRRDDLESYFTDAGFVIDFQWERKKGQGAFIIAKKPD